MVLSATPTVFKSSLGNKVAKIGMDATEKQLVAASLANLEENIGGVASWLIQTLKGTLYSSGYSTDSAKIHCRQH